MRSEEEVAILISCAAVVRYDPAPNCIFHNFKNRVIIRKEGECRPSSCCFYSVIISSSNCHRLLFLFDSQSLSCLIPQFSIYQCDPFVLISASLLPHYISNFQLFLLWLP